MRDFSFTSSLPSFEFSSYRLTAMSAKASGVIPLEEPTERQIEIVQGILDRCLPVEVISRWLEGSEEIARRVDGVYLFDPNKQGWKSTLRDTYAVTRGSTDCAIIGLSTELLNLNSDEFKDIVFLHETAHTSVENLTHDDDFVRAWDLRLEQYFCFEEKAIHIGGDGRKKKRTLRKY